MFINLMFLMSVWTPPVGYMIICMNLVMQQWRTLWWWGWGNSLC